MPIPFWPVNKIFDGNLFWSNNLAKNYKYFKNSEKYYKYFSDLKLLDYKVRILNTGTGATTRVSIESTDKSGKSWFTIGVSQNIIEASFSALIDSLEYKLFKEKAPANIHEK